MRTRGPGPRARPTRGPLQASPRARERRHGRFASARERRHAGGVRPPRPSRAGSPRTPWAAFLLGRPDDRPSAATRPRRGRPRVSRGRGGGRRAASRLSRTAVGRTARGWGCYRRSRALPPTWRRGAPERAHRADRVSGEHHSRVIPPFRRRR